MIHWRHTPVVSMSQRDDATLLLLRGTTTWEWQIRWLQGHEARVYIGFAKSHREALEAAEADYESRSFLGKCP